MHAIKADVVIVGGGIAGTTAALTAQTRGLRTVLVSKGQVGRSGASILAAHFHIGGTMLGGDDETVRAGLHYSVKFFNSFLIDQEYNRALGEWSEARFADELEAAGLYIRRGPDGAVATAGSPARNMCAGRQGQSGVRLMDLRRKQLLAGDVTVFEETMVTSLLTRDDGTVCGVTALDYRNGDFIAVAAKAVVLATGHADRLAPRATATREQSADGLAMAWRAGAELANLEIQWWHASDIAHPPSWARLHVYPNPLIGTAETARLYNSRGEAFFTQKDSPYAGVPYVRQIKRLVEQVAQGNARLDGGYYTSWEHIDPEVLRTYNSHAAVWDKLGLDIAKDRLETAPTWHFRQGGINADPFTLRASLPGLFVAGAVGGHYNGGIQAGAFDGTMVIDGVADWAQRQAAPSLEDRLAHAEHERLTDLRRPATAGGVVPAQIKRRLREVMGRYMGPVKNETTMTRALEEILDLRRSWLPRMGLRTTSRRFNYSWVDAIDVENLLTVAEVHVRGALLRQESRGPFYRTDFPETDNENWLRKNVVWSEAGAFRHRTEPYSTPYLEPETARADWFALDW